MLNILKQLSTFSPFIVSFLAFASLYFKCKTKDDSCRLLLYFMLAGSIFFGINILRNFGYFKAYNFLYTFYLGISLCGFPIFYLYLRSLTLFKERSINVLLHFLPSFLMLYPGSIMYFVLDYNQRFQFLKVIEIHELPEVLYFRFLALYFYFFKIVFIGQIIYYLYKIKKVLNQHEQALNDFYSDSTGYQLNWVKTIFLLGALWSILAIIAYIFLIDKLHTTSILNILVDISIGVLFGSIHILGSMQKAFHNGIIHMEDNQENPNIQQLKTKLISAFAEKELYLKKDLTIWDVCRETNSNRTYISNLINDSFGMNFNSFVNTYRVEKAALLLTDNDYSGHTIEEIASNSGFNSLASFNRVFKKFKGSYPGNYRKLQMKKAN
jgi:AraC-like DNA-binding protein